MLRPAIGHRLCFASLADFSWFAPPKAREAYKHLNEGGRIILTSSNTAKDFSVPKHSLYSGSKGAIDSFVRTMAKDCGDKKITVNAVAPGGTVTDMFHKVAKHYIPNGDDYTPEQIKEASILPKVLQSNTG